MGRSMRSVLQQLGELQPAPSVGMQDVPRESLGEHLGFGNANNEEPMDELDERLAQHTRFVYGLQEAAASDNESDGDDADSISDDSHAGRRRRSKRRSRRRTRKRMSITTNRYYDVPRMDEHAEDALPDLCAGAYTNGAGQKRAGRRRFFQSAARWDPVMEKVLVEWDTIRTPRVDVAAAMANPAREWGQRNGYARGVVGEDGEEEDGAEEEMEVDEEEGEDEG
ncbi:uncharacterized protein B0H18DRAFT_657694 [Fomitopsis serialis]|uniref:uncharacterized protein n=1 Tax=Fomitopsis serialis TaxID=139415 RepID=UPI00200783FE|nr:uncharacterized protein B0H18DRAFT_657694 [Neoantrodia serialis]KAH9919023.1 hypothetical protein B0H18DRAFT_657694 [Neoantrodia serialis]